MIKESSLALTNAKTRKTVDAGDYFIQTIAAGETVRIIDLEGNQAADTLFYNAHDPSERYSATDTIREQAALYLTTGSMLKTNLNRDLIEIVADTCGRHDTVGGACSTESNTVRYDLEKRCMHACRDSWMLAIAEHEEYGLAKEDIGHNINFFMNVPVTPDGQLQFADGVSAPGKYVELTAKMDTIVLISNCPQLNNPCNAYNPTPVEVVVWGAA
ncbi:MAG: urea carboxylase-associated protein 1 [Pseudohongiellaceae bacterium]|jgi:urea carboxylase-associated protein 1